MEDRKIVDLFFARNERAIHETQQKYGKYCHYVANNILRSDEDSEECVNDAYLRTWNAIPPSKPENLKAFVGKVTRNLALDMYDKNKAQKRADSVELVFEELEECLSDHSSHGKMVDELAMKNALNKFLGGLDPAKRLIFMQRYWYLLSVKDIAEKNRISETSVKSILLRLRSKFKKHLEKEGVIL